MLAEFESGRGPCGVSDVMPAGGRDAGVPGHFHDRDGGVAQGGHDLGSAAGADLGGVFAIADVANMVQRLDLPVASNPGGKLGGVAWWASGAMLGSHLGRDPLPHRRQALRRHIPAGRCHLLRSWREAAYLT